MGGHGEETLREEEDRIERERFETAGCKRPLSAAARDLLRCRLAGDDRVTPENLAAYRELARQESCIRSPRGRAVRSRCFGFTRRGLGTPGGMG